MTLDAVRAASRKAQEAAASEAHPAPPAVCPYCGRDDGTHITRCKLWMFTPEVRQKLYGYPTCLCHGLPDGKERDVIHNDEMTLRIARMSLSDFGPTR